MRCVLMDDGGVEIAGDTPCATYRITTDADGQIVDASVHIGGLRAEHAAAVAKMHAERPRTIWLGAEWYGEPFPLWLLAYPFRACARAIWPSNLRPSLRRRGCGCLKRPKDKRMRAKARRAQKTAEPL